MRWVLFLFSLRIFYTEDHLAYKYRQPVGFLSCLYAFYFLHFERGLDPHRIMLNMSGGNEHPHSDGNAIMHRRTKTSGDKYCNQCLLGLCLPSALLLQILTSLSGKMLSFCPESSRHTSDGCSLDHTRALSFPSTFSFPGRAVISVGFSV